MYTVKVYYIDILHRKFRNLFLAVTTLQQSKRDPTTGNTTIKLNILRKVLLSPNNISFVVHLYFNYKSNF